MSDFTSTKWQLFIPGRSASGDVAFAGQRAAGSEGSAGRRGFARLQAR
jgi:hypothetical protein